MTLGEGKQERNHAVGRSFKHPMDEGVVLNSWGRVRGRGALTLGGPSERGGFGMEEWG